MKYYMCIKFCLCAIYFYFAWVNFHACYVGKHILWRTPGIFSRRKEIFTMVFQFQCAILIYLFLSWYILSLLVLCKNYMRKCFNHFYKIKICKSVKNHPWNLKKTKIAICGFQEYAQKNLFSSFSIMFKPVFDYVLSTLSPPPCLP